MLKTHSVVDGGAPCLYPMILGIESRNVLGQVGRWEQRLLEVAVVANAHKHVCIIVSCDVVPGVIGEHSHKLPPVVLLVISMLVEEASLHGVGIPDLGDVARSTGNPF